MLRANGKILMSLEFFPFMLSSSKHSEPFFSGLLEQVDNLVGNQIIRLL